MRQELTATSFPFSFLVLNESPKTKFETAVTEAIEDMLSSFGSNSKQAIYSHLERRYGLGKEEIPFKIEDFARAIEQTFGSAAGNVEIKIIECLHAKCQDFSYVPRNGELDFVEFIYNLQNHLQAET